jgi:hypothetical protein
MPVRLSHSVAVLIILAFLLPLSACDRESRTLRMYIPSHQQFNPESLQSIFAEQADIRTVDASSASGLSPLEALSENKTDLTLLENSTAFVSGVRAVLPLYESVLHVLVRQNFTPQNAEQPLRGTSFFVVDQSVAGQAFVKLITRRQGLTSGEYLESTTLEPGITDVIIYFGPIDVDQPSWYHPDYELVSPGKRFNPQGGFFDERVGYIATHMKPKIIPAFTYDLPGNDEPLLTIAVDTLLVTRKDMPDDIVYELTQTLLEQKPRFAAIAPHLFSGINESFDPMDLSFPLHDGARQYLDRNEPGFLERYAESVNVLVYLAFLLLTSFLALARWRAHRKKDRMDTFYVRVLAVRDRMGSEGAPALLGELANIEREAFQSLIDEKLAANDSFRIFTDLLFQVRTEVRSTRD